MAPSPEGVKEIAELTEESSLGAAHGARLHNALEAKRQELESLRLAYNHWYTSKAVYLDDEAGPRPALEGGPITELQINTYLDNRLPHKWLDIPGRGRMISTTNPVQAQGNSPGSKWSIEAILGVIAIVIAIFCCVLGLA